MLGSLPLAAAAALLATVAATLAVAALTWEKLADAFDRCKDDVHTLVVLVAATGSSAPVVASAAATVACEVR